MARIRTIKPTMAESRDMAALSYEARYFFLLLLCFLDDEGRCELLLKRMAGEMYPLDDDVTPARLLEWIDECQARGMLQRYSVGDRDYLAAVNFLEHQKIERPTRSKYPAPPPITEASPKPHRDITEASPKPHRLEVEEEVGSRKEEISIGVPPEKNLEDDCPHVEAIPIDDEPPNWFELFWDTYPPRAGDRKRAASEDKFKAKVKAGVDPRAIIAGAERYRAYCDATRKTKTELVQQATTWLNNRAWLEPFEIPDDAPSPPQRNGRKESPTEVYARLERERLARVGGAA